MAGDEGYLQMPSIYLITLTKVHKKEIVLLVYKHPIGVCKLAEQSPVNEIMIRSLYQHIQIPHKAIFSGLDNSCSATNIATTSLAKILHSDKNDHRKFLRLNYELRA